MTPVILMTSFVNNTIILFFNPRNIPISLYWARKSFFDVLEIRYLPHDVAWKVAKKFMMDTDYEYAIIQVDDVVAFPFNYSELMEANKHLGDVVISALMELGQNMGLRGVYFSVTDKVLERRPFTYAEYGLWDMDKVLAKLREGRYHKVFYTGFGLTLMPKNVLIRLSFEPMARYKDRIFGYWYWRPVQIDVRTSMELWEMGIPHYVDLMNLVNHLGNLRYMLPKEKVEPKVVYYGYFGEPEDLTENFPIEKWLKEHMVASERIKHFGYEITRRIRRWFNNSGRAQSPGLSPS